MLKSMIDVADGISACKLEQVLPNLTTGNMPVVASEREAHPYRSRQRHAGAGGSLPQAWRRERDLAILSQATGLGKGSLYNFFSGGKEQMMAAVLADIDDWFRSAIFVPLEQPGDPATAVRSMVAEVTTYF